MCKISDKIDKFLLKWLFVLGFTFYWGTVYKLLSLVFLFMQMIFYILFQIHILKASSLLLFACLLYCLDTVNVVIVVRDALNDIFEMFDLTGNGLWSRDEFRLYNLLTSDQELDDAEWQVVEGLSLASNIYSFFVVDNFHSKLIRPPVR